MTDRRARAILAAHWLEFAGFTVKHFDHVDVVTVEYGSKLYFVNLETNIKFGISFVKCVAKKTFSRNSKMFTLCYDDDGESGEYCECNIMMDSETVTINGVRYVGPDYYTNIHFGVMVGKMFLNFRTKNILLPDDAFEPNPLPDYYDTGVVAPKINLGDILCTSTLLPSQPEVINIINEGRKMVMDLPITNRIDDVFTIIGNTDHVEYIVDGNFVKINNGPFMYMRKETNEEFALLFDEESGESYLVSANQIIKLTRTKMYEVENVGGLYCDLQIHNNMANLACYENNEGEHIDFNGNPSDVPVPCIYYYNYILFAFNMANGKLIELEATKPTSGMKTKPALRDSN
jgi:hypothetical protein